MRRSEWLSMVALASIVWPSTSPAFHSCEWVPTAIIFAGAIFWGCREEWQ